MDINQRRNAVKQYDLVKLSEDLGFTPIAVGRRYFTLKEHDSVRIRLDNNTFKRFSNGVFGDSVSFLMEFGPEQRSKKFKSLSYCLYWLEKKMNIENTFQPSVNSKPKPEKLELPERDDNYRRIFAYLKKTRCIDTEIIQEFIKRKMLYQEKKFKNAVFIGYDEKQNPVYCLKKGTLPNNHFFMEVPGCNYDYGIDFSNENSDTLFVTEAVIDMMSLMTIHKEKEFHKKHSFLSICGVEKDDCIYHYLDNHPNIKEVVLALDNDKKGIEARTKIQEKLKEKYKNISRMVTTPACKDWNEDLVNKFNVTEDEIQM